MEVITTYEGTPLVKKEDGNVQGMVPAYTMEGEKPTVVWHGAPFPRKLYLQTVAFARYCAEKYGGEVQGRLYYSNKRRKWKVCVLPQYVSRDLASLEIKRHKGRNEAMKSIEGKGDWKSNGTWHSHAFSGAGQSSTDEKDELRQDGFHYTVGSMGLDKSSFHGRFVFNKMLYDISSVLRKATANPKKCVDFPPQWKDALIMAVRPATATKYISGGPRRAPIPSYGTMKRYEGIGYGRSAGFTPNRIVTPTDDIIPDDELADALASTFREPRPVIKAFCDLAMYITGATDIAEAFSLMDQEIEDISADAYTAMASDELNDDFFGSFEDDYRCT